jgi:uncharacterized RDD family membrane protein YckC
MQTNKKGLFFDPHGTARAEALAGVPLARFWQRAAAFAIDFALVILTYSPVEVARQYLWLSYQHQKMDIHAEFDFHHWTNVIWMVVYFGLFVWKTNGLTPGKRLLRIRVVSLTRERISFWQAAERALGYGASVLEGGLGFVQYFTAPNHCTVHDRIAETIVVRDRIEPEAAPIRKES